MVRKRNQASTPADAATRATWPDGTAVHHERFGDGVVISSEGQGDNAKVKVDYVKVRLLRFFAK